MMRFSLALAVLGLACGNDVSNAEQARRAYIGLDPSVDKAINLGFDGFNMATNANIAPQTAHGTTTGTLTVTGTVDQGASANKTMHLAFALDRYSDDGKVTYGTDAAALPVLTVMLHNIPNGTVDGSIVGKITMTGELTGDLNLTLTLTGQIMAGPNNTVVRVPGSTHVTGTATSRYGTYAVDVTR